MPQRPAKPCRQPGCPELVHGPSAYCRSHQQDTQRVYDQQRGSSAQRGYGARWRRLRRMKLANDPLCADPFNVHADQVVIATEVDHITPKVQGGQDVMENLQSLCKSCHSRKTRLENAQG